MADADLTLDPVLPPERLVSTEAYDEPWYEGEATSMIVLVELEVWAENQKGEKVVTGRATVALPARA